MFDVGEPARRRGAGAAIVLPFCLGYFVSYLLRAVNAVIGPELVTELDLSVAQLGLLTSTYSLAFALSQLPVGLALDRFGARRVVSVLLVVATAGTLLFATGPRLRGAGPGARAGRAGGVGLPDGRPEDLRRRLPRPTGTPR